MRRWSVLLLTSLLAASLILTSCGRSFQVAGTDLMAGVEAASWPERPAAPAPDFISSLNTFSWQLLRFLPESAGNQMIAPVSVYLALAMTLNGADGPTRAAMLDTLAASELDVQLLNRSARDYMIGLMQTGEGARLQIANSIWLREGFQADRDFLQQNADYYAAAARALDFSDPAAVEQINRWVSDATEGTIDEIIDQIDPMAVMFLINAIYFNAEWQSPFTAEDTRSRRFDTPAGPVEVPFMHRQGSMDYLAWQGTEGLLLPYRDPRFVFIALLPEEGRDPGSFLRSLDEEKLSQILASAETAQINLALPKFKAEFEKSLRDPLAAMGMGLAFEPAQADFSRMAADGSRQLYIEEVKHKTFIRVDEKGTEAAAVTSVEMRVTSMPEFDQTLVFDRPFIYAIIDRDMGIPLFIGLMENPG